MPEQQNQRVLVLFAHPSQARSEINTLLFDDACRVPGVTAVDLYGDYPTFNIDIDKEQQRLVEHDVVLFQFPLYWYSTPSILKEWQDLVLEYGFAYGHNGHALKHKLFLCALTAGGRAEAYQTDGYNHFTIRQLLQPLEQMANLTGMRYLPPLALFSSRTAKEEHRISRHRHRYQRLLKSLVEGSIDYSVASSLPKMNQYWPDLQENY